MHGLILNSIVAMLKKQAPRVAVRINFEGSAQPAESQRRTISDGSVFSTVAGLI